MHLMYLKLLFYRVKENIANFGGDTSKITIFGQSAGGESTIIHYLSDDMQDKFNNVIVQSSPMAIPFRFI